MTVSEYRSNRTIRIQGLKVLCIALNYPETIAISVNGKGIILYDYQTLAEKTSLNANSVSLILLNSVKLVCIDSKTMIKGWNLSNHGFKSQFHCLLWQHSHEIQKIQFYNDIIVSLDNHQCYFWNWNTKNCIKVIDYGFQRAIIYKRIIGLFGNIHLHLFEYTDQISEIDRLPLTFIIRSTDQFFINSENITIRTRLTEHVYNIKQMSM